MGKRHPPRSLGHRSVLYRVQPLVRRLRGALVVESANGQPTVQAGQAVHARPGEWVRYSTPGADGAEYISVCVPAFTPETVHRDG